MMASPASSPSRSAIASRLLDRWVDDPVAFTREALGLDPWDRQAETMHAVALHDRVAVRSGHKVGKSTGAASLALWYVATRPRARVILTSASARQVKGILWKEIRRLYAEADRRLASIGGFGGKISVDPNNGLQFQDDREIVGFSTDEPERFAGISGPNMLFIPDEASGIPESIFEVLEGNRAGGAKVIMYSNPTRTVGTFYEAFTTKREFWHTIHISSRESPNVTTGQPVVPGLATRQWIDEKDREWGPDSDLTRVRVDGDFPKQGENSVIGLALVEAARDRYDDTPETGRLRLGLDVARYGDDETVLQAIRGDKALPSVARSSLDGPGAAGVALQWLEEYRRATGHSERASCKVDVIGVGASAFDSLNHSVRASDLGLDVTAISVSERPTSQPRDGEPAFAKLRDQLWFGVRDWLQEGGSLPPDDRRDAELVAAVYAFDAQGRYRVASKEDIKKVLKRSPDRADALGLATYDPPPGLQGGLITMNGGEA